ncbi:MAG: response regulator [Kiritimatiellae bacterium]|nr:response regulator [Kiritimatiellia bacterium]
MKVLIAEDNNTARTYLTAVVQRQGYQWFAARDGVEALELFESESPDLVITDIQMPRMDGITLLQNIREKNTDVVVIIITGEGSAESASRALHSGANNYLQKPVSDKQLLQLLRKYAIVISERDAGHELSRMVLERSLIMQMDNRVEATTRMAQYLVAQTKIDFTEKERLDLILGLDELLSNAIEHGNLGITQQEKEKALYEPEGLRLIHEQRLSDDVRARRLVTIEYHGNRKTFCEWIIRDEGDGFNWREVPNPLAPEAVYKPCGRGIFLSRMIFDYVEYRDRGNVVCVRKNLH